MQNNQLAQINVGKLKGFGSLGLEGGQNPLTVFNNFLSGAIGLLTVIAAIWFIFNFIIGAIGIISAGGDKAKVESSRSKITTGILGIVIVVASLFIIQFIADLVGLGDIILNPTAIIERIRQ